MQNDNTAIMTRDVITLCIACLVLSLAILAIDLTFPLGVAGGVPYVAVILISQRTRIEAITIIMAILCSALTISGFFLSAQGTALWLVLVNRALALLAIWSTAFLSLSLTRELNKEINALRNILPICAACKKIRDDEGYWNQIEAYFEKHSDAKFSHGICPDCRGDLYPDVPFRKAS